MVLLPPCIYRKVRLSNVNLSAFKGNTVCSQCPQFQVVLEWPKEPSGFPRLEANRLDVLPRQLPANAAEGSPDINQENDSTRLVFERSNPLGTIRYSHSA
jgi:hypothetical protein